ncbi:MAG: M42 family metallopeptidase [Methanomassiliicoccales archaeon]
MNDEELRFLEELCNSHGPSGFEGEPTSIIKGKVEGWADRVYTDRIGSLVFEKGEKGPKVLIPGHVDEIGFIITGVNEKGFLTFHPLGGWFDQVLLGQKVVVMTSKGKVGGVIAAKPPHLMEKEEAEKVVTKDKMFIDIGCSNRDEVKEMGVKVGDAAVPDSTFSRSTKKAFKDGVSVGDRTLLFSKAFDDRAGAFLSALVLKRLSEGENHPNTVVGAATVQEEVGLRGARTVANMVKPDVALVVDTDIAGDVPGIEPEKAPSRLGGGVSILTFDHSMIPNQGLKEMAIQVCEEKEIPYQLSHVTGGGTDAGVIHISNIGCPSLVICPPVRHIHSHVGIMDLEDLDNTLRLLVEMVKRLDLETVDDLVGL